MMLQSWTMSKRQKNSQFKNTQKDKQKMLQDCLFSFIIKIKIFFNKLKKKSI